MDYTQSPEQAAEYATSAVALMKKKGIPANPENFTVWFNYFSGQMPDLKRALEILLDNDQEFTNNRNIEIHTRFFTFEEESAAIHEATEKAVTELTHILEQLGLAGDEAAEYGKALEEFSGEIKNESGPDTLKAAITSALSATRAMEKQNQQLEQKFEESSKEISQLREDLETMREEAMTDGLTGIANRKMFDAELRHSAMQAMEKGDPLCLLMLDIDHFKKFNDAYGHQVGDQVLKLMASTMTTTVKGRDMAARFGGEEFCVILPGTKLEGAVKVAEDIRQRIGNKKLVNRNTGDNLGQVTVSVGAGEFRFGEPLAQLITRTDEALYMAKRIGRNRVVSDASVENSQLSFDG